jgi:hypothetical protein
LNAGAASDTFAVPRADNDNLEEYAYFERQIDPALLVAGDNVIAVEVHQHEPDTTDLSFDLTLSTARMGATDNSDGDSLTVTIVSGPSDGGVVFDNTNGTFTYTHTANSTDPDSFTYEVDDGTTTRQATVTINVCATPEVSVDASDDTATEPAEGQDAADLGTFTVTLDFSVPEDLTVYYTLTPVSLNTAMGGVDYEAVPDNEEFSPDDPPGSYVHALSGSIIIAANSTSAVIDIDPLGDAISEGSETVTITLATSPLYTVNTSVDTDTVTIVDYSYAATVKIEATDPMATESSADEVSDLGKFTITRTGSTSAALDVNYTVVQDEARLATLADDFTSSPVLSASSFVTIPIGESSLDIVITPLTDFLDDEGVELVRVQLDSSSNYGVEEGYVQAEVKIYDDADSYNQDDESSCSCVCEVCMESVTVEERTGSLEVSSWFYESSSSSNVSINSSLITTVVSVTDSLLSFAGAAASAFVALPKWFSDENPHPITRGEVAIPTSGSETPDRVEARLTVGTSPNHVEGSSVYFDTSGRSAGDISRFALQVDTASLPSGRHDYTIDLTYHYPTEADVTATIEGSTDNFNRTQSEFGNRWWIEELDRLYIDADPWLGDVSLFRGDGSSARFRRDENYQFVTPAGSSSTFTKHPDGTYTLRTKYGDRYEFDEDGLLTARIDSNENTRSYVYVDADSDGETDEISTITDEAGRTTTYTYGPSHKKCPIGIDAKWA